MKRKAPDEKSKLQSRQRSHDLGADFVHLCDTYSWLPLLVLERLMRQNNLLSDWKAKKGKHLRKSDLCDMLAKHLKVEHPKEKYATSDRFYRSKFHPLLQKRSVKLFEELLQKEREKNTYLPSTLTQQMIRNHYDEWFGSPLLPLNVTQEEKQKLSESLKHLSNPYDSSKDQFVLEWENGSLHNARNFVLAPNLYAQSTFTDSFPRRSYFNSLTSALALRKELAEIYQKVLTRDFNVTSECKVIYPEKSSGMKCDPLLVGDWVGSGSDAEVYVPLEPDCQTPCGPNGCVVKATTEKINDGFFRIVELLQTARIPITPRLRQAWSCNGKTYLLYDRIVGETLFSWKERHHMRNPWQWTAEEINPEQRNDSENRLSAIFLQLLEKVKEMHRLGISHGDLHQGNILVDEAEHPWIIDFEGARLKPGGRTHNLELLWAYNSPYLNQETREAFQLYRQGD